MTWSVLADLEKAGTEGDAASVQQIATQALVSLSPSGVLTTLAEAEEARRRFDELTGEFDADETALAHLDRESLVDRLEDDFALAVPLVTDAAAPLLSWAIPLLSALAGPFAPLLSFGLAVACKVALAALQSWAKKRAANMPQKG